MTSQQVGKGVLFVVGPRLKLIEYWSKQISCFQHDQRDPSFTFTPSSYTRYVLHKRDSEVLQPVRTDHLAVYSYRKTWTGSQNLKFFKGERRLKTGSQMYILFIERLLARSVNSPMSTPATTWSQTPCSQVSGSQTPYSQEQVCSAFLISYENVFL